MSGKENTPGADTPDVSQAAYYSQKASEFSEAAMEANDRLLKHAQEN